MLAVSCADKLSCSPRAFVKEHPMQATSMLKHTGSCEPVATGVSRRQFLQGVALTGAAVLGCPTFVRSRAPGDKLNIALIGCGGRGAANMREMLGENIVALCDVNEDNLLKAASRAPHAKKFRDFRKLYDE